MTEATEKRAAAQAKAREIRKMIFEQPPEVIAELSDGVTFDDEFANCQSDIHDAIDEMFSDNGYPDSGTVYKNQKVYTSFSLPILKVDITVKGDQGEETFDWEFSVTE